jgi:hypothetical protein
MNMCYTFNMPGYWLLTNTRSVYAFIKVLPICVSYFYLLTEINSQQIKMFRYCNIFILRILELTP